MHHSTIWMTIFGTFILAVCPPVSAGLFIAAYLVHRKHRGNIKAGRTARQRQAYDRVIQAEGAAARYLTQGLIK